MVKDNLLQEPFAESYTVTRFLFEIEIEFPSYQSERHLEAGTSFTGILQCINVSQVEQTSQLSSRRHPTNLQTFADSLPPVHQQKTYLDKKPISRAGH